MTWYIVVTIPQFVVHGVPYATNLHYITKRSNISEFSTKCVLTFRIVLRWGFELFVHYLSSQRFIYKQSEHTSHNTLHYVLPRIWMAYGVAHHPWSRLVVKENQVFCCILAINYSSSRVCAPSVCLLLFMFDTSTEFTFKEPFSESFSDKYICGDMLKSSRLRRICFFVHNRTYVIK